MKRTLTRARVIDDSSSSYRPLVPRICTIAGGTRLPASLSPACKIIRRPPVSKYFASALPTTGRPLSPPTNISERSERESKPKYSVCSRVFARGKCLSPGAGAIRARVFARSWSFARTREKDGIEEEDFRGDFAVFGSRGVSTDGYSDACLSPEGG